MFRAALILQLRHKSFETFDPVRYSLVARSLWLRFAASSTRQSMSLHSSTLNVGFETGRTWDLFIALCLSTLALLATQLSYGYAHVESRACRDDILSCSTSENLQTMIQDSGRGEDRLT